jgi:hypothetical protein
VIKLRWYRSELYSVLDAKVTGFTKGIGFSVTRERGHRSRMSKRFILITSFSITIVRVRVRNKKKPLEWTRPTCMSYGIGFEGDVYGTQKGTSRRTKNNATRANLRFSEVDV